MALKNVTIFATFNQSVPSWAEQAANLQFVVAQCINELTLLTGTQVKVTPLGQMKTTGNSPTVSKVKVDMVNTGNNDLNYENGRKVGLAIIDDEWKPCINAHFIASYGTSALLDISSSLENALLHRAPGLIFGDLPIIGDPSLSFTQTLNGYEVRIATAPLPIASSISFTGITNSVSNGLFVNQLMRLKGATGFPSKDWAIDYLFKSPSTIIKTSFSSLLGTAKCFVDNIEQTPYADTSNINAIVGFGEASAAFSLTADTNTSGVDLILTNSGVKKVRLYGPLNFAPTETLTAIELEATFTNNYTTALPVGKLIGTIFYIQDDISFVV